MDRDPPVKKQFYVWGQMSRDLRALAQSRGMTQQALFREICTGAIADAKSNREID